MRTSALPLPTFFHRSQSPSCQLNPPSANRVSLGPSSGTKKTNGRFTPSITARLDGRFRATLFARRTGLWVSFAARLYGPQRLLWTCHEPAKPLLAERCPPDRTSGCPETGTAPLYVVAAGRPFHEGKVPVPVSRTAIDLDRPRRPGSPVTDTAPPMTFGVSSCCSLPDLEYLSLRHRLGRGGTVAFGVRPPALLAGNPSRSPEMSRWASADSPPRGCSREPRHHSRVF